MQVGSIDENGRADAREPFQLAARNRGAPAYLLVECPCGGPGPKSKNGARLHGLATRLRLPDTPIARDQAHLVHLVIGRK